MNKIAFIGAGNMASAIISGLVSANTDASNIMVSNPSPEKRERLAANFHIHQSSDNIEAAQFADIIVLCVKPHLIAQVCQDIAQSVDITKKLFISVAAGTTVKQIQQALETCPQHKTSESDALLKCPVVRVMPNTPAQIGLGMSGLFASKEVNQKQKTVANELLCAVGKVIWLNEEEQINDIIAVAGSAPAYFFLFMEAMEKHAQTLGFSAKESRMLVQQTALGAAQMVEKNDTDIRSLRENVTSEGGATFAALEQFRHDNLDIIVKDAMNAAITRSQEMAKDSYKII
jgi:pyrroline-5-carboxylate reductase